MKAFIEVDKDVTGIGTRLEVEGVDYVVDGFIFVRGEKYSLIKPFVGSKTEKLMYDAQFEMDIEETHADH